MIKNCVLFFFMALFLAVGSAVAAPAADFTWSGDRREGLPEGRGVATFTDGRIFAGEMAAGLFTGTGTLTLPGGERYTGEFAAGQFQGQGVYTFANGDRYVGEFQAGLMHGTGIFRLVNSSFTGPVNIGSEERVTINHLAEMVMTIAGKTLQVRHIPGPQGVRGRNSDNRLITEKLGWAPTQPLHQGLALTYAWIAGDRHRDL